MVGSMCTFNQSNGEKDKNTSRESKEAMEQGSLGCEAASTSWWAAGLLSLAQGVNLCMGMLIWRPSRCLFGGVGRRMEGREVC